MTDVAIHGLIPKEHKDPYYYCFCGRNCATPEEFYKHIEEMRNKE